METEIKCSAAVAGAHGAAVEVVGAAHFGMAAAPISEPRRQPTWELVGQLHRKTLPKMD